VAGGRRGKDDRKEKTLAPLNKLNENARIHMGQEIRGWKVYAIVSRKQKER
jgi:hypothetical protein